jgi:hypothetical protein
MDVNSSGREREQVSTRGMRDRYVGAGWAQGNVGELKSLQERVQPEVWKIPY